MRFFNYLRKKTPIEPQQDPNDIRAARLIETYGFEFDKIPGEEIRRLLESELLSPRKGSGEYMRVLCGYLFCIGNPEDAGIIEMTKYSAHMDLGCMVDQAWIDSLEGNNEDNPAREELIREFVEYYKNF